MKKIMFDDHYGLEKAVLEGRKTMTRRVITVPDKWHGIEVYGFSHVKGEHTLTLTDGDDFIIEDPDTGEIGQILPTYKIGEEVAVAQKYKDFRWPAPQRSDFQEILHSAGWNNKMFVKADLMPHRIRITNVRIERLQEISDEDCLREGIFLGQFHTYSFVGRGRIPFNTPREAFAALIDKVSGKGTWDSNPYVFVYEFELVKQ